MRHNTSTQGATRTENLAGGHAYSLSPEMELYTRVCTSLLGEQKYYESGEDSDRAIADLVRSVEPEFVAGLAVYARREMQLRSVPLYLVSLLSKTSKGRLIGKAADAVVQRADQIMELLAIYGAVNGRELPQIKPLSKQIKRGLEKAFNRFDEYQFAKYNRKSAAIKLKDALCLVRPRPHGSQAADLFRKIANGALRTPETWEVEVSAAGKSGKENAKKEAWEKLIRENKLGYMAMLRNLRNILEENLSQADMDAVISKLTNPDEIRNSRQLPFRFLSAFREVGRVGSPYSARVLDALERAIIVSADNIPRLEGATLIAIDTSGSMESNLSRNGSVTYKDVALTLGSLANRFCAHPIVGIFGGTFKIKNFSQQNILTNVLSYETGEVGHASHGFLAIKHLFDNKISVDRIMLLTDMQLYGEDYDSYEGQTKLWLDKYKREVNPHVKTYFFDLSGYGTAQVPEHDANTLLAAGWSEKIFDLIRAVEARDRGGFMREIEEIGRQL